MDTNETNMYTIWESNPFNDEFLIRIVARFYDLELAKDFVKQQASMAKTFVIVDDNNERIDLEII